MRGRYSFGIAAIIGILLLILASIVIYRMQSSKVTNTKNHVNNLTQATGPAKISFSPSVEVVNKGSLTNDHLLNCQYYIYNCSKKIKLTNGVFENNLPVATGEFLSANCDNIALGDLNNDGINDAALILYSNAGGSAIFTELAVIINDNGYLKHIASIDLGDGVKINSLSIKANKMILDMLIHGPKDSPCCPTLRKFLSYQLVNNKEIRLVAENNKGD